MDVEQIQTQVSELIERKLTKGELDLEHNKGVIKNYSRKHQVKKLAELLNSISRS